MTEPSMTDPSKTTVAVTGAAGFIGTWVTRTLLERGYHVHATVRDPSDERKVGHLHRLPHGDRLQLFAADLLTDGAFDAAFAGCRWLCHMASPVLLNARDPQKEIIFPAVKGTTNALRAAERVGTIERIVLTSSIAAIAGDERVDRPLTEEDWNESSTAKDSPYPLSKTLAERAAWEFIDSLPAERAMRLVTINPGFVLGPLDTKGHVRSSPATVYQMLKGRLARAPRLHLNLVDVREVAEAHVRALEMDDAHGRYLLTNGGLWMLEMAQILREELPGARAPTKVLPDPLMYLASLFDKRLSFGFLRHSLGRVREFDNTRAREELGITFRPLRQSVIDTGRSMLDGGYVG